MKLQLIYSIGASVTKSSTIGSKSKCMKEFERVAAFVAKSSLLSKYKIGYDLVPVEETMYDLGEFCKGD